MLLNPTNPLIWTRPQFGSKQRIHQAPLDLSRNVGVLSHFVPYLTIVTNGTIITKNELEKPAWLKLKS